MNEIRYMPPPPRVLVVPMWAVLFSIPFVVVLVLVLGSAAEHNRTRANAAESELARYRAERLAQQEQLADCVAYSSRVADRLDRISDLLSEGY
jgi:hypothetical protein